jgi:splicing factor 3A subunit 1
MASPNGNGNNAAVGASDLKPPPHIVIPPLAVREDIEKTADYISRRGELALRELKGRLVAGGEKKKNFMFMAEDDSYHPYYQWYLEQMRQGKGPTSQTAKAVAQKPKGPPEPPKFRFSARMPNISAQDLDVLKLTALYTARIGENWLKDLRNREAGNSQFEWLRANHSFFPYFRSLVEQYKILLEEHETVQARIDDLQANIKDRFYLLNRAKERSEYVRFVTAQKEKEEKKAEAEKREFATIDWQDFSVIATVLFDETDDAADMPPPALLNDLQSQSLEQKAMVSLSTRRLEEALPDQSNYYNVSQQYAVPQPMPAAYPVAPAVQAPYGGYVPPPMDYRSPAERAREDEQARVARERNAENEQRARMQAATRGAPGRIVTDYVPRAAAKKATVQIAMCPNCKQQIPADEMDEHIRSECPQPLYRSTVDIRFSRTSRSALEGATREVGRPLLDHYQHRRSRQQPQALCQPTRRHLRRRHRPVLVPRRRTTSQARGFVIRRTAGPGQGRCAHGTYADYKRAGTAAQATGEAPSVSFFSRVQLVFFLKACPFGFFFCYSDLIGGTFIALGGVLGDSLGEYPGWRIGQFLIRKCVLCTVDVEIVRVWK